LLFEESEHRLASLFRDVFTCGGVC
jgi:hypothetical protein